MPRFQLAFHAVVLTSLLCGLTPAGADAADARPIGIEIEDFMYLDTSGEPTNQAAVHQARLEAFMAALRHDVTADSRYRLLPFSCTPPCTADQMVTADQLHAAAQAGTNFLVIGGIQKTSTLVQWARVRAIDVNADRMVFEKLYTFRGDNDEAWRRAETFLSDEIREVLASPAKHTATPAPTKMALFDFELEDTSAAAATTGETASDAKELENTTDAIRKLLTQSGRYTVVPVSGTDADAVKAHAVHGCDGCGAKIAQQLGADQSLVGVIRRISRTEYTVQLQIRDARTGNVISSDYSGLRMGANYSWSRGAERLVRDRLIEPQQQQSRG